ncbi:MAG: ferritin-like domain-containing protein [Syntrophales bacterium]
MAQISRAKQKEKVLEVLNKARAHELHAIHLYMHQHYNLDNWDYGTMAVNVKLIAIDEMRHAEMLADRIEELGGVPTAESAVKTKTGQKVEVIFRFDADLEDETIADYNEYVRICKENDDHISAKLFELLMDEEQVHYNYFDNVDTHIKNLGGTYLAQIAGTPSSTGLATQGFVARQSGGGLPGA